MLAAAALLASACSSNNAPQRDDEALRTAASLAAAAGSLDDPSDFPVETGPFYEGPCAAVVVAVDDAVEHLTVFSRWADGWDDVAVVSGDVSERIDPGSSECWEGGS